MSQITPEMPRSVSSFLRMPA